MTGATEAREPGIYIDLPEDEYFAGDALGGSSFKTWLYEPQEWWWDSPHNPNFTQTDSNDGQTFGTALHCAVLEGLDVFHDRYSSDAFDPDDYPDAFTTAESIELELARRGLKKTGRKSDIMERLRAADPDATFLDEIKAAWDAEREGVITLPKAALDKLTQFGLIVRADPKLKPIFKSGLPEVSVFWEEAGIACRARFDWMTEGATYDLKTYAGRVGDYKRDRLVRVIMDFRYDIQQAHYMAARAAMPNLPIIGGTAAQRDYVARCAAKPFAPFRFLFAKTTGAPILTVVDAGAMVESAQSERVTAMAKLRKYLDAFGTDDPWLVPAEPMKVEFTDVPSWFGLAAAQVA